MSLQHPLLAGHAHGFGMRDTPEPEGLLRPKQVHGRVVVSAAACRATPPPEADAVLSSEPGVPVGVLTADCVPVLLATESGGLVAAAHAGWRGLAHGILSQSVDAMRRKSPEPLVAVIGPHIGPCCYEVDAPVLGPLREAFGDAALDVAVTHGRPGHAQLDLACLARHALAHSGVAASCIGVLPASCTHCDALRFHSYRRDGPRSGRLLHHIAARKP